MKNRKLMLVPIAVLSLGAVIGCNSNKGSTDTAKSAIEKEIDDALVLPENLTSMSRFDATEIAANLRKGFKDLLGVQSKNFSKTYYSNIYTGSYAKLIKDNELSYEIETNRYSNAVATITTNKHDVEIENGIRSNYDSSRKDLVYYKNIDGYLVAVDNIEFNDPDSFGEKIIGRQKQFGDGLTVNTGIKGTKEFLKPIFFGSETSANEQILNFMNYFDSLKMGADGRNNDLGYFFKQNDKNIYCVTFASETTKVKNATNPTLSINQITESKTVMHFENNGTQWLSKSYASSINKYYDRDLDGNIFTVPALVSTEKFVSKAKYGIVTDYVEKESIVDPVNLAGESTVNSYLKLNADDTSDDRYQYDDLNTFTLFDVSTYAQSDDYVFTVVDGVDKIERKKAKVSSNAGEPETKVQNGYTQYNPLYMVTQLYVDNYISQRNSYLEYRTIYLSNIRKYSFYTYMTSEIEIDKYELDTESSTEGVSFDKTTGELTVTKNGNYHVTLNVAKDGSYAKIKVQLVNEIVDDTKENNYYKVNVDAALVNLHNSYDLNVYVNDDNDDEQKNYKALVNDKIGTYRAFNYTNADDQPVQEKVVLQAEGSVNNYILYDENIEITGASVDVEASVNGKIVLSIPESGITISKINFKEPKKNIGNKDQFFTLVLKKSTKQMSWWNNRYYRYDYYNSEYIKASLTGGNNPNIYQSLSTTNADQRLRITLDEQSIEKGIDIYFFVSQNNSSWSRPSRIRFDTLVDGETIAENITININSSGKGHLTKEQLQQLQYRGHEVSVYWNSNNRF